MLVFVYLRNLILCHRVEFGIYKEKIQEKNIHFHPLNNHYIRKVYKITKNIKLLINLICNFKHANPNGEN